MTHFNDEISLAAMLEHRRIYFHYSFIQFEVLKFPVKYDVTLGGGGGGLAKRDGA